MFDGNVVRDALSDVLKAFVLIVSLLAFVYARPWLKDRDLLAGEYYVLVLFAALGMMVMISANSFLTVYLGLELLALCLALVAFDRDSEHGAEAAMKYFVLGALGSGMLLYGISMIYGATGSIELGVCPRRVGAGDREQDAGVRYGVHRGWHRVQVRGRAVPHVGAGHLRGRPDPGGAVPRSAPKIAAFALTVRLLVDGLGALHPDWQGMLVILAVLSMGLGNLLAIAQTNIKRMLAYSTISHVGFIFLGLLAGSAQGYASAMFYAIVYALMAAGAFGILRRTLSRKGFLCGNISMTSRASTIGTPGMRR